MPYTKQQIKDYALALEAKGAPASEIEAFVSAAAKEMTDAPAATAPAPAAAPAQPQGLPRTFSPKGTPERKAELQSVMDRFLDPRPMDAQMAKLGAMTARLAPAAMAMAAPPVGIAAWLGLGAVGAAGEMVAQNTEGRNPYTRSGVADTAKAGVLSAMPLPMVKPNTSLFNVGTQAVKLGTAGAATEASAETMRRSIEQNRLASYESVAEALKGTALPSIMGFGLGGASAFGGTLAAKGERFADNRQRMADVGVAPDHTTFAMIDPAMAKWEQHVAARNPEIQIKIGQAHSDITKNFYNAIGEAGSNTEIAAKLNPLIPKVDAAEVAFQNAEKAHQAALANFQKASEATLNPLVEGKIKAEVITDLLTSVSNKAAKIYEGNALVGFDLMTNTEKAAQLTGVVGDLFDARTAISKELYKDTKIPLDQPLFAKADLETAAIAGMAGRADTSDAGKIVQAIKGAGKDPTVPYLTLADFQAVRAKMSDAFANVTDPNALNIAEGLASRAYKAMGDASKGTIRANFGDDVLAKYDAAQAFWRDTSQARDSALGRTLLQRGDILDSTLTSMAAGIARGNVDELAQFKKFVGYIEEMSGIPGISKEQSGISKVAMQHMAESLKNAFVSKHSTSGTLNADGLLKDLMAASNYDKLPFPVESLGFGSVETIKQWRGVVREFKPGQVSESVMSEVLTDPKVQEVLAVGGKDASVAIREATARKVFDNEVEKFAAAKFAAANSTAAKAKADAEEIARKMRWDRDGTKAAFDKAMQDPVLSAFSGKGSYKLTDEMAKTGEGTITHLIANMDPPTAGKLMAGLRKNDSQFADLVESHILADEFKKLSGKDPKIPGSSDRLDLTRVDQYFNPLINPDNSRIRFLENTISPKTLDRFKTLATRLSKIDADAKTGKFPSDKELQHVVDTVSAGLLVGGSTVRPGLTLLVLGKVRDMVSSGAYHTLSAILADPKLGNALLNPNIGSISEAIGSLPAQKAYLLMNDAAFQEDVRKLEQLPSFQPRTVKATPAAPAEPPPAAPAPAPQPTVQAEPQFQEGRLYLDPETGVRKRYRNGAFV